MNQFTGVKWKAVPKLIREKKDLQGITRWLILAKNQSGLSSAMFVAKTSREKNI